MDQFNEPIDLALKGDKKALLKWCFARCHQVFNLIYEYEQKNGSFWSFDDRYYEHGIQILYERFCYAMGIIVDQFHIEWRLLFPCLVQLAGQSRDLSFLSINGGAMAYSL